MTLINKRKKRGVSASKKNEFLEASGAGRKTFSPPVSFRSKKKVNGSLKVHKEMKYWTNLSFMRLAMHSIWACLTFLALCTQHCVRTHWWYGEFLLNLVCGVTFCLHNLANALSFTGMEWYQLSRKFTMQNATYWYFFAWSWNCCTRKYVCTTRLFPNTSFTANW